MTALRAADVSYRHLIPQLLLAGDYFHADGLIYHAALDQREYGIW